MSLFPPEPPPQASTSAYSNSPRFVEAVNDSRFVQTFGLVSFVAALVVCIGGAVTLGVGIAVAGFGHAKFYKVLGVAVTIMGLVGFAIAPVALLGKVVLCAGVGWKAFEVIGVLASEGKGDPDWGATRTRAIVGLVASILGAFFGTIWLALTLLGIAAQMLEK